MAALMVFGVFLVSIALSIPIATSMIVGSISPILLLGKGGSIVQLLKQYFLRSELHPHSGSSAVHPWRRYHGRGWYLPKIV